jgi:hypothetical protein
MRQEDRAVEMSSDHTRVIVEAPCGVACYEGSVEDGCFNGLHVGAVATWDDAKAWLAGGQPESFIKVWTL